LANVRTCESSRCWHNEANLQTNNKHFTYSKSICCFFDEVCELALVVSGRPSPATALLCFLALREQPLGVVLSGFDHVKDKPTDKANNNNVDDTPHLCEYQWHVVGAPVRPRDSGMQLQRRRLDRSCRARRTWSDQRWMFCVNNERGRVRMARVGCA
jgi:hypothetical protein